MQCSEIYGHTYILLLKLSIPTHTFILKSLSLRYGDKKHFRLSFPFVNDDTLKQSKKRSMFRTNLIVSRAESPNFNSSATATDSDKVLNRTNKFIYLFVYHQQKQLPEQLNPPTFLKSW